MGQKYKKKQIKLEISVFEMLVMYLTNIRHQKQESEQINTSRNYYFF